MGNPGEMFEEGLIPETGRELITAKEAVLVHAVLPITFVKAVDFSPFRDWLRQLG
jgi:hypothetical protein